MLCNVLMDGVFQMGSAMPAALPYLIRLTAAPEVSVRSRLLELLLVVVVVVAGFSHSVGREGEHAVQLFGNDRDHPERTQCRAVFADHADLLRALLDDGTLRGEPLRPDERESPGRGPLGPGRARRRPVAQEPPSPEPSPACRRSPGRCAAHSPRARVTRPGPSPRRCPWTRGSSVTS